jgi:excisionase family DNA binding protein
VHKIENSFTKPDTAHRVRQLASPAAFTRLAYSPSAGAQALGISRSKLYELIAEGELKIVKLGSRTLVPHSELVRFLTALENH